MTPVRTTRLDFVHLGHNCVNPPEGGGACPGRGRLAVRYSPPSSVFAPLVPRPAAGAPADPRAASTRASVALHPRQCMEQTRKAAIYTNACGALYKIATPRLRVLAAAVLAAALALLRPHGRYIAIFGTCTVEGGGHALAGVGQTSWEGGGAWCSHRRLTQLCPPPNDRNPAIK